MLDCAYKEKIINELIENRLEIIFHLKTSEETDSGYVAGYEPITENNIVSESMVLKQSICDEEKLKFGGCIASEFNIQLLNTAERSFDGLKLKNQWITVKLYQKHPTGLQLVCSDTTICGDNTLVGEIVTETEWTLFVGFIDSAKRSQDDENVYKIVAYDRLAKLYNTKISGKLYKAFKSKEANCRDLLALCCNNMEYIPYEFLKIGIMRNYDWEESKDQITKGELLKNICEINGGFGYFLPHNKMFRIKRFSDSASAEVYNFYESLKVSDDVNQPYTALLFPYAGDIQYSTTSEDWGGKIGLYSDGDEKVIEVDDSVSDDEDNSYYDLTENILARDYSDTTNTGNGTGDLVRIKEIYKILTGQANFDYTELETELPSWAIAILNQVAQNKKNQLETTYTPLIATVDYRPWVEVGDNVIFKTPKTNIYGEWLDENGDVTEDIDSVAYELTESIVMSRTLTGIKALTDEIEAKGEF